MADQQPMAIDDDDDDVEIIGEKIVNPRKPPPPRLPPPPSVVEGNNAAGLLPLFAILPIEIRPSGAFPQQAGEIRLQINAGQKLVPLILTPNLPFQMTRPPAPDLGQESTAQENVGSCQPSLDPSQPTLVPIQSTFVPGQIFTNNLQETTVSSLEPEPQSTVSNTNHLNSSPVQEHINSNPTQEHINSSPVQEHINSSPAQEHINSSPVQEHVNSNSEQICQISHLRHVTSDTEEEEEETETPPKDKRDEIIITPIGKTSEIEIKPHCNNVRPDVTIVAISKNNKRKQESGEVSIKEFQSTLKKQPLAIAEKQPVVSITKIQSFPSIIENQSHVVIIEKVPHASVIEKQPHTSIIEKQPLEKIIEKQPHEIKIEKQAPRKILRIKKYCCNTKCYRVGYDLRVADKCIKQYYIPLKADDAKAYHVCNECYKEAEKLIKQLTIEAKKGVRITASRLDWPKNEDTVIVVDDSDDETENEDETANEEELPFDKSKSRFNGVKFTPEYIISRIDEKVKELRFKENINLSGDQLCETADFIDETLNKMKSDFRELKSQECVIHREFYKPYEPVYAMEVPLDIVPSSDSEASKSESESTESPTPESELHSLPVLTIRPVATKSTHRRKRTILSAPQSKPVLSIPPSTDPDIEILSIGDIPGHGENLPPKGELVRGYLKQGDTIYSMKKSLVEEWVRSKIEHVIMRQDIIGDKKIDYKLYKTRESGRSNTRYTRTETEIAYFNPSNALYPVGTRVIAWYTSSTNATYNNKFYAGVIAEPPRGSLNKNRYLVFFDDGCAQYTKHENIRLVVMQSENVWEDVLPEIQDFIKQYVSEYPERPMVKMTKNMLCKTELNARWWMAKVKKIDCSMVLIQFPKIRQQEWIYRGSARLGPLFAQNTKNINTDGKKRSRIHRSTAASRFQNTAHVIEYNTVRPAKSDSPTTEETGDTSTPQRSVARKSTKGPLRAFIENSNGTRGENIGTIVINNLSQTEPTPFYPHPFPCTKKCVGYERFHEGMKVEANMFWLPLDNGWSREQIPQISMGKPVAMIIHYRSPCGRRIRNVSELHRFLRMINSTLGIDLFTFESKILINRTFAVENALYNLYDITYGVENAPVQCVNTISYQVNPAYVRYDTGRISSLETAQHLQKDPGFLVCCDCVDDCQSASKCACRQLTIQESLLIYPNVSPSKFGYNFKRLQCPGTHQSAIYECNKKCKCALTCLNRVVQNKMKVQLQLFCTEERGWGIRALHDLPVGTFICPYTGMLLTEEEANALGKEQSDEYLADLDYIEGCEIVKADYESEAQLDPEDFENSDDNGSDSDESTNRSDNEEFVVDKSMLSDFVSDFDKSVKLRRRNKVENADNKKKDKKSNKKKLREGDEVEAPKGGIDNVMRKQLFGSSDVFVMDANERGNLGRWFNHSCSPNVVVKNVFIDSHDLRFPWIGFFTNQNVSAGSELCWDYAYEVNSTGKRIECKCGSINCRERLL